MWRGQGSAIGAAIVLAATTAAAAPGRWVGTWGAAPQPPSKAAHLPPTQSFKDVTLIQVLRVSAGGDQVRVRFTNEYGSRPLVIGAAQIVLDDRSGRYGRQGFRTLTFGRARTAVVPAGAPMLSDPVSMTVPALSKLLIRLYLPQDTGPCTCHSTSIATGAILAHDNLAGAPAALRMRAFISGVEVHAPGPASAIVVLGDSIADGVGSTHGANRRWTDVLAERLNARDGGRRMWGVVNEAIAGNRLNADGAGQSALARLDRDVLSVPGAAYLIVSEGVNDLGMAHFTGGGGLGARIAAMPKGVAGAQDLIAAYRRLIVRGHAHGLKVIGATITPYQGAAYWSAEGEADRRTINQWIRTSGAFDGVLDFDRAWRDPANPSRIKAGLHAGDHLHGDDAGYQTLADSIALGLFQ